MIKRTHPLVETIPNQPVQTAVAVNEQMLDGLQVVAYENHLTGHIMEKRDHKRSSSAYGSYNIPLVRLRDVKAAIAAAKAVKRSQQVPVNEQMLRTLKIIRGKHACGALTLPKGDFEQVDEAIVAAEAAKKGGGDGYMGKAR